jgi:aspartate kinase
MQTLILKFGGSSVASVTRIEAVADIVAQACVTHRVAVVLSAMGGETDRLIALAHSITPYPSHRELDMLVSTGEQVTIALLAMALEKRGIRAKSLIGEQIPIITNNTHTKARIESNKTDLLLTLLDDGQVPIVAGFQGVTQAGERTTLGRGGSDTSAVAIAAVLNAAECQIYTDVKGVYTTDPRLVHDARLLRTITFEEMLEMASLGAKVLQIRSVEFAGRYKVPLRVRSTFEPDDIGTLITLEDTHVEYPVVSGIAFSRDEAKLTLLGIPDKPGVAARVLGAISEANIDVDMIVQSAAVDGKTDFTFTVHRQDYDKALEILREKAYDLSAKDVQGISKIAKISLVGVGMRSHAGIASTMFDTLGRENINIIMVTTSEIKISVGVDEKYLELGVRALHSAFNLDKQPQEETLSRQARVE